MASSYYWLNNASKRIFLISIDFVRNSSNHLNKMCKGLHQGGTAKGKQAILFLLLADRKNRILGTLRIYFVRKKSPCWKWIGYYESIGMAHTENQCTGIQMFIFPDIEKTSNLPKTTKNTEKGLFQKSRDLSRFWKNITTTFCTKISIGNIPV